MFHSLTQEPRLIGALPLLTYDFQDCSTHLDNCCDLPAHDKEQKSLKTLWGSFTGQGLEVADFTSLLGLYKALTQMAYGI